MLKVEFEGTDGAGKTTGLKYFIEQAQKRGFNVVETREVGNPSIPACVKLREFVLDPNSNLSGEAMELIFSAMRFENDKWLEVLEGSQTSPDLVVSDRGWFSHLAYTDHNVTPEFTNKLYKGVVGTETKLPDVVLYFEVSTETALKRRVKRGTGMDVIEMKGIEFQEKVRNSFSTHMLDAAKNTSIQFYRVNANTDIQNVQEQLDIILDMIQSQFSSRLKKKVAK
jgi:dTMP kinase